MDAIAALAATVKAGNPQLSSRSDNCLPDDISRDMSSQCQTLHRNPEAIEVAIASAKEGERIPTKEAGGQKIKVITR